MVSIVSGAAVNCGTECRVVQDAKTLMISPSAGPGGAKTPDVVLYLDGRDSTITQSLDPPVQYKAVARWDGVTLVVTRSLGRLVVTQRMSLENGMLTVLSTFNVEEAVPVTLTYRKE